tara:strand:- start:8574 stop:9104 length:531 start_codon:yes stop_codon:yes gene_type:complete
MSYEDIVDWAKANNLELGEEIKNENDLENWGDELVGIATAVAVGQGQLNTLQQRRKITKFSEAVDKIKKTEGQNILKKNNDEYLKEATQGIEGINVWEDFKEFKIDEDFSEDTVDEITNLKEDKGFEIQEDSMIRIREATSIDEIDSIVEETKRIGKFRTAILDDAKFRKRELLKE